MGKTVADSTKQLCDILLMLWKKSDKSDYPFLFAKALKEIDTLLNRSPALADINMDLQAVYPKGSNDFAQCFKTLKGICAFDLLVLVSEPDIMHLVLNRKPGCAPPDELVNKKYCHSFVLWLEARAKKKLNQLMGLEPNGLTKLDKLITMCAQFMIAQKTDIFSPAPNYASGPSDILLGSPLIIIYGQEIKFDSEFTYTFMFLEAYQKAGMLNQAWLKKAQNSIKTVKVLDRFIVANEAVASKTKIEYVHLDALYKCAKAWQPTDTFFPLEKVRSNFAEKIKNCLETMETVKTLDQNPNKSDFLRSSFEAFKHLNSTASFVLCHIDDFNTDEHDFSVINNLFILYLKTLFANPVAEANEELQYLIYSIQDFCKLIIINFSNKPNYKKTLIESELILALCAALAQDVTNAIHQGHECYHLLKNANNINKALTILFIQQLFPMLAQHYASNKQWKMLASLLKWLEQNPQSVPIIDGVLFHTGIQLLNHYIEIQAFVRAEQQIASFNTLEQYHTPSVTPELMAAWQNAQIEYAQKKEQQLAKALTTTAPKPLLKESDSEDSDSDTDESDFDEDLEPQSSPNLVPGASSSSSQSVATYNPSLFTQAKKKTIKKDKQPARPQEDQSEAAQIVAAVKKVLPLADQNNLRMIKFNNGSVPDFTYFYFFRSHDLKGPNRQEMLNFITTTRRERNQYLWCSKAIASLGRGQSGIKFDPDDKRKLRIVRDGDTRLSGTLYQELQVGTRLTRIYQIDGITNHSDLDRGANPTKLSAPTLAK